MANDALLIDGFARAWRLSMKAAATLKNYRYSLERVSAWLATMDADLLTAKRADLEAFLEQRYTQVAPRTAHTDYKALRAFYKWAVADEDVDVWRNPMANVTGPSIPTEETEEAPVVVTLDAYRAAMRTCRVVSSMGREARTIAIRDAAILAVLWWTGMRRGEVSLLNVGDVDVDQGVIYARKTKVGKPRTVPILDQDLLVPLDRWLRYRQALRTSPDAEDALFIGMGRNAKIGRGRLLPDGVGQVLLNRGKLAKVHLPAHGFRRARAEEHERRGVDPLDSQRMLGWADDRMRRRYTRAHGDQLSNDRLRNVYADALRPARFDDLD